MATPEELTHLINVHLGDLKEVEPNWTLAVSELAGRGVFATRDIAAGELIFCERAVVVGPTGREGPVLNTCVCCYKPLGDGAIFCKHRCALPVCEVCTDSEVHRKECQLFRSWEHIDLPRIANGEPVIVNAQSLRILTAVRILLLDPEQRAVVDALQANADGGNRREVNQAAECFRKFPTNDKAFMDSLIRAVAVLNTNAFQTNHRIAEHETPLRSLFPLTAIMNHDCTPNANPFFDNEHTALVRAARSIPKGAELKVAYANIMWNNLVRYNFLKNTKDFVCECARCNDITENGTYLSALFCRGEGCKGIVIPVQTKTQQPDWRCLTCNTVFPHTKMARYQEFALTTINGRINSSNVHDLIQFINEMCPRFCPPSNYVLIEAKLNVIWRMSRLRDDYTAEELAHRDRYKQEILETLDKLGAGECTLKKLITEELQ